MSGQNNYLGMVTNYKMRETEMGYRGSKSEILKSINFCVKEQRVDGSCCKINNIAIKVYSNRDKCCFLSHNLPNQIRTNKTKNKKHSSSEFTNRKKIIKARLYSTSTTIINCLNPFFITG
jgi:hypothetical protein